MKKILLFIFLTMGLVSCSQEEVSIGFGDMSALQEAEVNYELVTVARGDVKETFSGLSVGAFPRISTDYSFAREMTINEVYFTINENIEAGELIVEFDTDLIDQEILLKEYEVDMEQIAYDEMKKAAYSPEALRIKAIDLEIVKLELDSLYEERKTYFVYAPTRGYIQQGRLIKGGKYAPMTRIFNFANNEVFNMSSYNGLKMSQYHNVQIGDKVSMDYNGGTIEAWVSYISVNQSGEGQFYFETRDQVEVGDKMLYMLYPEARFVDLIEEDVIYVPNHVLRNNIKDYVELYQDGVKRIRYVRLGTRGFDENGQMVTQIIGGLREGEEVISKRLE